MWFSSALLLTAAIAALAAGLLLPLDEGPAKLSDHAINSRATTQPVAALPPLSAFEPVWTRTFRQPETVASSPQQPEQTAAAPMNTNASPPPVVLAGTIGNSLAIFRLPDGSTVLKAVGEEIGAAHVVAIGPARVVLREGSRDIELSKPPANP